MKCAGTASQEGRVRIQNAFHRLEMWSGYQGLASAQAALGAGGDAGASGEAAVVQRRERGSSDHVLNAQPSAALPGRREALHWVVDRAVLLARHREKSFLSPGY